MIITKTGALVDTDPAFSNPMEFEVNGMSRTVGIDNLLNGTNYYVKGYVVADGTRVYSTNVKDFRTESDAFTIINEYNGDNTITLDKINSGATTITLDYSTDNGLTWRTWTSTSGAFNITLHQGEKVKLKGDNSIFNLSLAAYSISATNNYSVGGNLTTLIDSTGQTNTIPDYTFAWLFKDSANLISARRLHLGNVTYIGNRGLYSTFNNCSSLVDSPNLSGVTSIGEFALGYCFQFCSSLTTPPDLSGLTAIPEDGLNLTFGDCSSMVNPPDLHNVTSIGENGLQNTFNKCTSLVTTPDLRNTTSIDTHAIYQTYIDCFKLKTVYAPNIDTWSTPNATNWLARAGRDESGTKTVYIPNNLCVGNGTGCIPTYSYAGIPPNWNYTRY